MYVVTALLQGTLLVMGIYFEYLGPKKDILRRSPRDEDVAREVHDQRQEEEPSEQTPLLQS